MGKESVGLYTFWGTTQDSISICFNFEESFVTCKLIFPSPLLKYYSIIIFNTSPLIVTSVSSHDSNGCENVNSEPERCDLPRNSTVSSDDEGGLKIMRKFVSARWQ